MARGFRIKLGKGGSKALEGLGIAAAVTNPVDTFIEGMDDKGGTPITARRLKRCTIATRAHLEGIADLPSLAYQNAGSLSVTLLRLRVERPEGEVVTCVRQSVPYDMRRVVPGSSLRALAHEDDPRIVVVDWKATGEALGVDLPPIAGRDQYKWPDQDEWPAVGMIEVRHDWQHRRRIQKRRAEWVPAGARLTGATTRGSRKDDREQWKLDLDLGGRLVTVKEGVPDFALLRLVGYREGESRFGGFMTTTDTVVNVGATLAVLVAPDGEVAVDWQATLNQPDWRAA